jgi:hypothetical protein
LREGGNAIEAMVAAAATIAVVYPHMNSIGGDGFWLISEPGTPPLGIDACGRAARLATPAFHRERGYSTIEVVSHPRPFLQRQPRVRLYFRLQPVMFEHSSTAFSASARCSKRPATILAMRVSLEACFRPSLAATRVPEAHFPCAVGS